MPILDNPVDQLASIVSKLYELAGNSRISDIDRSILLLRAHDLRGDLISLVSLQFMQNTAAYQAAMKNLSSVTDALNQAENDIKKVIGVVNGVGQLAASVDDLLKEAVQASAKIV